MYEESSLFDPNISQQRFLQTHLPNYNFSMEMELELQKQVNIEMEMQSGDPNHLLQVIVCEPSWQTSNFNGDDQNQYHHPTDHILQPTTPDNLVLNNIFSSLPKCSPSSLLPPITLSNGSVVYDPNLLPLNLPLQPQPPLLRELYANNNIIGFGSLFDGVDNEEDWSRGICQDGDYDNGVFQFSAKRMDKNRDAGKDVKTERDRRVLMNDKYQALRNLIPNPTKNDRASIVGDAICYINKLKEQVTELKFLVKKKRCARGRLQRCKTESDNDALLEQGNGSTSPVDMDQYPENGSTSPGSSCVHKKSETTEIDVHIVDDEVTVKLVQQKKINCLLSVSRVLNELHLDLHHVTGGLIGNHYSFLFNSKICEGSVAYSSAIANKLIEVVDKHYAAISTTSSS